MSGRSSIPQRSLAISSSRSADSAKGRIVAAKRPRFVFLGAGEPQQKIHFMIYLRFVSFSSVVAKRMR
ncbi:hypothetical protein I7I50_07118 [Histoplasma capsulatum G186AR]|uniref:Uncharacterized protein n=1 Tax=Ajellomyces capsulatus TaxID=5037 RepID=A0A8H7YYF0_AJECA|nr:hypothetical protein I7I52_09836 [Histoplasma capsulatum]QSS67905.1 hypothetical protein I7I50_07118 [Histoplasma capsulatum G186AR]